MIGNYTYSEWLKMGNTLDNDQVLNLVEEYDQRVAELQESHRDYDLSQEQAYNAKDVIEQILALMETETRCKELKKGINLIVENSYVEL